ncbi:hypothetical protein MPSEU_001073500 [Mayamaea pseudoterrestris]|nr:hypothetical protein MPSEU_001073500 [Mayamaea pseudoterrestris]
MQQSCNAFKHLQNCLLTQKSRRTGSHLQSRPIQQSTIAAGCTRNDGLRRLVTFEPSLPPQTATDFSRQNFALPVVFNQRASLSTGMTSSDDGVMLMRRRQAKGVTDTVQSILEHLRGRNDSSHRNVTLKWYNEKEKYKRQEQWKPQQFAHPTIQSATPNSTAALSSDDANHNKHDPSNNDFRFRHVLTVNAPQQDHLLTCLDDGMETMHVATTHKTDDEFPLDTQSISDGTAYDDNADDQSHVRDTQDALKNGICLLRAMSSNDFDLYDSITDDHDILLDHMDQPTENYTLRQVQDDKTMEVLSISPSENVHKRVAEHDTANFLQEIKFSLRSPSNDTHFCNILLLRVALTMALSHDLVLEALMNIFHRMQLLAGAGAEQMQPNEDTYEIVIHALHKRLRSFTTGTDVIHSSLRNENFGAIWNHYSLLEALQLCDASSHLDLALQLVARISDDNDDRATSIHVPPAVFQILVRMSKRLNRVEDAATVVKICLERHQRRGRYSFSQEEIESVLVNVLRWPDHHRSGQRVGSAPAIHKVLAVLKEFPDFRPGYRFWREAIVVSARGADLDVKRWIMVRDAFQNLSVNVEDYWPDHKLLTIGLKASEALDDASLAADIVRRIAVQGARSMTLKSSTSQFIAADMSTDSLPSQRTGTMDLLSVFDLEKAVMICRHDAAALRSLLESIFDLSGRIPLTFQQYLFELGVKSYAAKHEPETAEALLVTLIDRGFELSEDTYGAVIYAFAKAGQPDQALLFFQDMESGELPCNPGPSSYNGLIVSHLLSHAWSKVFEKYEAMQQKGMLPLPPTHHAALLATYRCGGKETMLDLLDKIVASEAPLSASTCKWAAKIVLELDGKTASLSSDDLQSLIVNAVDDDVAESLRTIMGSWTMAERKEESVATGSISRVEHERKRRQAWAEFLLSLNRHTQLRLQARDI